MALYQRLGALQHPALRNETPNPSRLAHGVQNLKQKLWLGFKDGLFGWAEKDALFLGVQRERG